MKMQANRRQQARLCPPSAACVYVRLRPTRSSQSVCSATRRTAVSIVQCTASMLAGAASSTLAALAGLPLGTGLVLLLPVLVALAAPFAVSAVRTRREKRQDA